MKTVTTDPVVLAIRTDLKAIGYSAAKVSVRRRPGGIERSIHITIRDASVDHVKVAEIGDGYESIRRCEASGDILGGGNTYVWIHWSDEARAAKAAPFMERAQRGFDVCQQIKDAGDGDGTYRTFEPTERFLIGWCPTYRMREVWRRGDLIEKRLVGTVHELAFTLACLSQVEESPAPA